MADIKYPPILKNTPYVGSATNRVVHKTDSVCSSVLDIPPNERWYIKDIPRDGNYVLCPACFPQAENDAENVGSSAEEPGRAAAENGNPSFTKGKAVKTSASKKKIPVAIAARSSRLGAAAARKKTAKTAAASAKTTKKKSAAAAKSSARAGSSAKTGSSAKAKSAEKTQSSAKAGKSAALRGKTSLRKAALQSKGQSDASPVKKLSLDKKITSTTKSGPRGRG